MFSQGFQKWLGFAAGASVFAVGAVFAAAAWGSLPSASSGGQVSSTAWNDVVGQINSIAGAVTVDGTHLASTLPTASNHLATKAYVDAAAWGGVTYQGLTTATYNGNLWGFAWANAKCQVNFAGSHMCSIKEILASDRATALANSGWTRFEYMQILSTTYFFDGMTLNGSVSNTSLDCYGWTSSSTSYYGMSLGTTYLASSQCWTSQQIHCCK